MARLSFALPSFARCERPRAASSRAWRVQPGRFAQGPDEKCGTRGRTLGITFVMSLSFQIGAPRWGGVSRGGAYGTAPRESSSKGLTRRIGRIPIAADGKEMSGETASTEAVKQSQKHNERKPACGGTRYSRP